jgi:hypothetical protein
MSDEKPPMERLSKVPSWIMLGFVIGGIVALTVKREIDLRDRASEASSAAVVPTPVPTPSPEPHHAGLNVMEDIFEKWQANAIWSHDLTQVAFWDPTTNRYSEYVEVLRNGDDLYFRTLPALTWPLIEDGVSPDTPLRFAEPESVHAERRANRRAILP